MDDTVHKLLAEIGYNAEDMKKEDLEFVYGFMNEHGGVAAVRESIALETSTNSSRFVPTPSALVYEYNLLLFRC